MEFGVTTFINGLVGPAGPVDIVVRDGMIAAMPAAGGAHVGSVVDLHGFHVLPGLVDGHMHLDKTLFGLPWIPHGAPPNRMGRIANDAEVLPGLPVPARRRAALLLDRAIANGTSHVRTHVDVRPDMGLRPLEEILAVREAYRGRVSVQIVAFPQAGVMRCQGVVELLSQAIDAGADLVGGIDPTIIDRDPKGQLDAIFSLAERKGVGLDIHLHEPGEAGLFSLEEICERTKVAGLAGRVTISHAFCLGMISESAARRAADLLGTSGVSIASHGGGGNIIPPVKLLRSHGITMFAGNDDIRDTWSPYGNADMLERAALIGWKSDFRTDDEVAVAFDIVSGSGARALAVSDYGLTVGCAASFFSIDAGCIAEAVGGHPRRSLVVYRGIVVARDGKAIAPA